MKLNNALKQIICFEKKLKFKLKEFQFIKSLSNQIFNGFILFAMLLNERRHRSVTIATTELSNVLLSSLADCRLNCVFDITFTLKLL